MKGVQGGGKGARNEEKRSKNELLGWSHGEKRENTYKTGVGGGKREPKCTGLLARPVAGRLVQQFH